jgi:dihydrolipoamide dehydrogenase
MADLIIMPKLGFNMNEGKLLKWYAKESDTIKKGTPLFSIETDKTSIDIEATRDGVLLKILCDEGDTVAVTLPIAIVGDTGENIDELLKDANSTLGKAGSVELKQSNQAQSAEANPSTAQAEKTPAQSSGRDFDVVVIGGGPGGYVAAIKAAQLGKKVAIVEGDKFGGVCLNKGCIPTKVLLKSASVLKSIKNSEDYGIAGISGKATLDMQVVQQRKTKVVSQLVSGVEGLLKANGVAIFNGNGEIKDVHTIVISGKQITADYIIIATGSVTKALPIAADSGMKVITSDAALELTSVPKNIVIVGGGVIGVEFADFFASAGSKVTVVEFLDRVLPMADEDVSAKTEEMLENAGVVVHTGAKVSAITKTAVEFEKDGKKETVATSVVLMSVGRIPNLGGIDCQTLGIKTDKGAIVTDAALRTSVDNVFAIGDVNGKVMLAHTASAEAIVAAENICGINSKMSYDTIPSVVFTKPEIAWVGLTESEARAKYGNIKVGKFPMLANGKAKVDGEESGFVKVIITEEYNEIVGVHLFCTNASDLIAEAVLAMNLESTAEEVAKTIHPHPTISEAYHEAFYAALDKAIHFL